MIDRRQLLGGAAAAGAALAAGVPAALASGRTRPDAAAALRALEQGDARLGVCFLDTATGEVTGNRLEERFAFCSTFKLALVGAVLREADAGRLSLAEVLPYGEADMLEWAPVTSEHLASGGMPIGALAQAAQEISDGTAANLLVRRLGGPAGVTAKFREMGDSVTRLQRTAPQHGLEAVDPGGLDPLLKHVTLPRCAWRHPLERCRSVAKPAPRPP